MIKFDEPMEKGLDSIEGRDELKYAMAVAVAGRHNIMFWGKPGCGKTMLLQRMQDLLPILTDEELDSVKRIYALYGFPKEYVEKIYLRPFRMPHQSASLEGMLGGGKDCKPGEISLAHNGVLFLDEAAEFRTSVLQAIRIPLFQGAITLSRAGHTTTYPSKIQLAMATNPCPCGNYGSSDKVCLCSAKAIEQYWKKISAPLYDAMAVRMRADEADASPMFYTLEELREYISDAWEAQFERQGCLNADLNAEGIHKYIKMDKYAEARWARVGLERELTGREELDLLRLARTIADMHGNPAELCEMHICRALHLHHKVPVDII